MDKLSFQELVRKIVEAIRQEARKIPNFDYGAIRLHFIPKHALAVDFFGGFGGDCDIDLCFAIREDYSYIRPAKWGGREGRSEVNCEGYAALKVAGCSYAINHILGRRSCDMPESAETFGRVSDRGCVVYDVLIVDRFGIGSEPESAPYFRLYVAVSGAEGVEDEKCAMSAGGVLVDWADTELDDDGFGHHEKYLSVVGPSFK